jgi:hypothetical protein
MVSARTARSEVVGDWTKYIDDSGPDKPRFFYHNDKTNESTYDRPMVFYTPRDGQVAEETVEWHGSVWSR